MGQLIDAEKHEFFLNEIISCSFVFRGPPIGNMKGRLRNYVFWY